ncbi:hypothetical protein BGW36DRAFT_438405 [Talaromyces proteolyticus]|uniref:Uncharacterized protein n=1 Tax=Talaromyces proteolyticus TaxID=1131652 RepID=A0AAD4KNE5_9EURO|nr:uncharacterized protein BGW36DRAFT_438405 [Talaromyces proteolyticus]KAH8692357.1 hypothetical protein BGW36DRAFT_438405 [Talaromyces proteolyticus]
MSLGITLENGCNIVHGRAANLKRPFSDIPVEMHELNDGKHTSAANSKISTIFSGQFGFISFDTSTRLPRHVHISLSSTSQNERYPKQTLVTERILVLDGVALVELNGTVYIVAPGSLVTIAPGVPHTWTACPAGVTLPDGEISQGTFLMVYEYEKYTGFFPTCQLRTLESVDEYVHFDGNLDTIKFPWLTKDEVVARGQLFWEKEVMKLE